jgi:hypothetical protein
VRGRAVQQRQPRLRRHEHPANVPGPLAAQLAAHSSASAHAVSVIGVCA